MKCETQQINYLKDRVAVRIFSSEVCRDYVKEIIKATIGYKEDNLDNLTFISPRVGSNINAKEGVVDVVFKCGDNFINFEVNYNNGEKIQSKNFAYLCHLYIKDQKKNEDYKGNIFYQININNYDVFKEGKFIYYSKVMEIESHLERHKYFQIIDINVAQLRKIDYNEIKKEPKRSLKRLLYLFVEEDKNKLEELYEGDEIMEKVREEIEYFTEEEDGILYYNPEELYRRDAIDEGKAIGEAVGLAKGEKLGLAKGKEIGLAKGQELGLAKGLANVARKMLQENVAVDLIKKYTGLTIKEINELKKLSL